MPETGEKTGQVTRERFDQIIAELREEMETDRRIQFVVGDRALEVEPMRPAGGSPTAIGDLPTVSASLHLLAEESGIPYETVRNRRWVAYRWPENYRRAGLSFHPSCSSGSSWSLGSSGPMTGFYPGSLISSGIPNRHSAHPLIGKDGLRVVADLA
ncbi:hypothetical protein [Streptomyces boluensis]|uniref:Uncharacterized protein n=1 Tax=Streptomyces boluensis TaxID=1775135 RepID=A0A964XK17_9ACTN|nr:hypothetical protein [Streptomyces boluensis]NBE50631.1 hypothetical protein [Streptomyces boluensis]